MPSKKELEQFAAARKRRGQPVQADRGVTSSHRTSVDGRARREAALAAQHANPSLYAPAHGAPVAARPREATGVLPVGPRASGKVETCLEIAGHVRRGALERSTERPWVNRRVFDEHAETLSAHAGVTVAWIQRDAPQAPKVASAPDPHRSERVQRANARIESLATDAGRIIALASTATEDELDTLSDHAHRVDGAIHSSVAERRAALVSPPYVVGVNPETKYGQGAREAFLKRERLK